MDVHKVTSKNARKAEFFIDPPF